MFVYYLFSQLCTSSIYFKQITTSESLCSQGPPVRLLNKSNILHSLFSFIHTCAMFLRSRFFTPGRKFEFFTLLMRFIAQRTSFGISVQRASRVLQFMTTIIKSNCPQRLLKQTARQGPAEGVTPVLMPEKVPIQSQCQSIEFVFFHPYVCPYLIRDGTDQLLVLTISSSRACWVSAYLLSFAMSNALEQLSL